MFGVKIDDTSLSTEYHSLPVYNVGDTVSLILQVDLDDISVIGDTIPIQIRDIFSNVIANITAERINDVYVAEWTVPLAIHKLYNALNVLDTSPTTIFYYLSDNWIFPDTTELSFNFLVERVVEEALKNNSLYTVDIEGVLSIDNEYLNPHTFTFSSFLTPFYCSIEDVKSVYLEELSFVSDVDIARDILFASKQVDLHMMPEEITRQDQFDLAVKMYVKYYVARQHLQFLLNINAESKELDMLKYSRNSNDPVKIIDNLDKLLQKYACIIWAGGKDTPFIPKVFERGIFDPNRPDANRASLDTSDVYPWVNSTTINSVVNINGNAVELRGTRTLRFLRNRSSYPDVYLRSEGVS